MQLLRGRKGDGRGDHPSNSAALVPREWPPSTPESAPFTPTDSPPPDFDEASATTRGLRFGKLFFAGQDLGSVSFYNGLPVFSEKGQEWIHAMTGHSGVFPALPGDPPSSAQPSLGLADLSLPEKSVVEDYLSFYRGSLVKLEFPVIDSIMFQETIRIAYGTSGIRVTHEEIAARACVLAFLSLCSIFWAKHCTTSRPIDGHVTGLKARNLLSAIPQDMSITVLQAILMLCLHQVLSGQITVSAIYHSHACRITFMLGGHVLSDPWETPVESVGAAHWTPQEKRQLRKLFWLCYAIDKEISLRTGQPPSISDDHCDLTLPSGYHEMQYLDEYLYAFPERLDESAVPLLPGDLRLTMIKSKACRLLYSADALRKSDADLLRDIRELDEELESWRLSVPPKHRPALSLSVEAPRWPSSDLPRSIRTIVVNFEYQHLMMTIHQATSRCRAWTVERGLELNSVKSSMAIAVEASRSTLLTLKPVVHELLEEATW